MHLDYIQSELKEANRHEFAFICARQSKSCELEILNSNEDFAYQR